MKSSHKVQVLTKKICYLCKKIKHKCNGMNVTTKTEQMIVAHGVSLLSLTTSFLRSIVSQIVNGFRHARAFF